MKTIKALVTALSFFITLFLFSGIAAAGITVEGLQSEVGVDVPIQFSASVNYSDPDGSDIGVAHYAIDLKKDGTAATLTDPSPQAIVEYWDDFNGQWVRLLSADVGSVFNAPQTLTETLLFRFTAKEAGEFTFVVSLLNGVNATITASDAAIITASEGQDSANFLFGVSSSNLPGSPASVVSVQIPESLDFGTVTQGQSTSQTIIITNIGNVTAAVTASVNAPSDGNLDGSGLISIDQATFSVTAGNTSTRTLTVTVPEAQTPGNYGAIFTVAATPE